MSAASAASPQQKVYLIGPGIEGALQPEPYLCSQHCISVASSFFVLPRSMKISENLRKSQKSQKISKKHKKSQKKDTRDHRKIDKETTKTVKFQKILVLGPLP